MTVPFEERIERTASHQPTDPWMALGLAVVHSAVRDVQRHTKRAREAAAWLRSEDASQYLDVLGIHQDTVTGWLDQQPYPPARKAGPKKGAIHMTEQLPTQPSVTDFASQFDQLDETGRQEVIKAMQSVYDRAKQGAAKRAQAPLRAEFEAEKKRIPKNGLKAYADLVGKYRRLGLDV
jgi:hypothetical protein